MREFYVITEAKIVKVDANLQQFTLLSSAAVPGTVTNRPDLVSVELTSEHLRGRRFCRSHPRPDVVIAWDSQLQDLLGVPIEAWDKHEKERLELFEEVRRKSRKLYDITHASWWTRFKWLFTGVKEID